MGALSAPPARSLRIAGYLSILFGMFGTIAGVAGAGTFIPFRNESTFTPTLAELLTVIAAAGAVVSLVAMASGWGLLRGRAWAWSSALGSVVASIGLNAAVTAIWTSYAPFLALVAVAYGLVILLLLVGRVVPRSVRDHVSAAGVE